MPSQGFRAVRVGGAITLLEEVDTARAGAALATVQTNSILTDHIHTHTHGALGEAGSNLPMKP